MRPFFEADPCFSGRCKNRTGHKARAPRESHFFPGRQIKDNLFERVCRMRSQILALLVLVVPNCSAWTPTPHLLRSTSSAQRIAHASLCRNPRRISVSTITPSMVYIDKSHGGPQKTELSGAWDPQSGQRSKEWFEQVEKERREKVCPSSPLK
jgi:hypothetical protein